MRRIFASWNRVRILLGRNQALRQAAWTGWQCCGQFAERSFIAEVGNSQRLPPDVVTATLPGVDPAKSI